MLKKTLVLGLLAAAMAIAPTAALAGQQSQENVQITEQNGVAENGSTNAQSSQSTNIQTQVNKRGRFAGLCGNSSNNQSQRSSQATSQNGAAIDGSLNAQDNNTVNNQRQVALSRAGFCR